MKINDLRALAAKVERAFRKNGQYSASETALRWPLFQIHFGGNLLYYLQFDKLRLKLEAAKRCGYDKAITFEFSHFMSPQSAYLQAGHLYDRYREYFGL